MPKRKKETERDRIAIDAAVGLCAWLITVELLVILERRGILRTKDTKRVVLGALNSLDVLSQHTTPHPAFAITREILMGQVEGWEGLKQEEL